MQINSFSPAQSYNAQNNPSFGMAPKHKRNLQKTLDKVGDFCKSENGSLSRSMFFITSMLFLVGARFKGARDKDERREVLTRDIPAVAISGYGALVLNNGVAQAVTKKSGIPIICKDAKGKFNFVIQKQVKDWYSNLSKNPDVLVQFSETMDRNGGNVQKVMNKFGFTKELEAITKATDNKGIIDGLKKAQKAKSPAFDVLENLLKNVADDNKVLKFAKKSQAYVKLGCVALTAAFLGFFLPRLNIIITKKKCEEAAQNQQAAEASELPEESVMKVSNYHTNSARQSFKNFFNIM